MNESKGWNGRCRIHSMLKHVAFNTYRCEYCGGYVDLIETVEYDWEEAVRRMEAILKVEGVSDGGENEAGTSADVSSYGEVQGSGEVGTMPIDDEG